MAGTPDSRTSSFGQGYAPTLVDRFGIWLSARQLRRAVPTFRGRRVGDFGCGFNATFVRTILDSVDSAVLIDVALADDLKRHPKVRAIEGNLPDALSLVPDRSLDTVMCINVLEHLWDPVPTLIEFRRVLTTDGVCLLQVPSWLGKQALEFSAYRLGMSTRAEVEDHKNYYDPRDLWPSLVRAGFVPSRIKCFRHKFGLSTFAVCRNGG